MIVEVWDRSGPRYQFTVSQDLPLPPHMTLNFGPMQGRLLNAWLMNDGTVVYLESGVMPEAVGA